MTRAGTGHSLSAHATSSRSRSSEARAAWPGQTPRINPQLSRPPDQSDRQCFCVNSFGRIAGEVPRIAFCNYPPEQKRFSLVGCYLTICLYPELLDERRERLRDQSCVYSI